MIVSFGVMAIVIVALLVASARSEREKWNLFMELEVLKMELALERLLGPRPEPKNTGGMPEGSADD